MLAVSISLCQTLDYITEFSQFCNVDTIVIFLLQMRKLKHKEVGSPIQIRTLNGTMHSINLATTLNI